MELTKEQAIYRHIRKNGAASKQDLVIALGYSLPTITQKLHFLEAKKLIDTSDKIENTGGRNAIAYTYLPEAKAAIGVYLTGHRISTVAVDLSGRVMSMRRELRVFDLRDEEYLRKIGEEVEAVKKEAGISDQALLGVGIALPGLISEDGETVIYGKTLNFTGMKREDIGRYIPYRNVLFHDSAAAGFGQVWESETVTKAFCITLSNSVGGAFVSGDQIYYGNSQRGAEIGHMIIEPENGELCYCGNRGCFDTVCRSTKLSDYADGNLSRYFELLDDGDEGAVRLWKTYIRYLAKGVHNIRMLFDCDIILGGYVGTHMEKYMAELCAEVDRLVVFGDRSENYIIPCRNRIEDTAAGAAILLIDEFLAEI